MMSMMVMVMVPERTMMSMMVMMTEQAVMVMAVMVMPEQAMMMMLVARVAIARRETIAHRAATDLPAAMQFAERMGASAERIGKSTRHPARHAQRHAFGDFGRGACAVERCRKGQIGRAVCRNLIHVLNPPSSPDPKFPTVLPYPYLVSGER